MIRRPPRSTLFPTRRSSDLAYIESREAYIESRETSVGSLGACIDAPPRTDAHPSRETPLFADGRRVRENAPSQSKEDRKSTRLNSSHLVISYAVFCLKNKRM